MSFSCHEPLHEALPGFEKVFRYFDPQEARVLAKILPGEFYVTNSPHERIVTTLGSCISVCIRDPEAAVGGMNHFMLPGKPKHGSEVFSPTSAANRYGIFAMESLVNAVLSA